MAKPPMEPATGPTSFWLTAPLSFGNIIFSGDVHNIVLSRDQRPVERWFNPDAGFEKNSARQLASNIRTFPVPVDRLAWRRLQQLGPFAAQEFLERVKFQLRAEAQDAMNHAMFAAPNTTPTSTLFGQVTNTVAGGQRAITLGGRLTW